LPPTLFCGGLDYIAPFGPQCRADDEEFFDQLVLLAK
jgi:hypothetical protein